MKDRRKEHILWRVAEEEAIARKQRQARALHPDFDAVIRLGAVGMRAGIGDGVLIARLFGNARVQLLEIFPAHATVENIATGRVGVLGQNIVPEKRDAAIQIRFADPDSVDGNIGGQ